MSESPRAAWLTIVGIGEDGLDGLSTASKEALLRAELVIGSPRHLDLLPDFRFKSVEWPVPFEAGIPRLLAQSGRRVVMLASGDPFWFGAGSVITRHLAPHEWVAHPAPSAFNLAAARLGWPLNETACLGLHAAPLSRLRPHLQHAQHALVLVRDGDGVGKLADYLRDVGFGASMLHIMEALGGPRERIRQTHAQNLTFTDIAHPVVVGIACAGDGIALPRCSGLPDAVFDHDGQISKRPIRALTMSALAPRPGERLWDIGAGSGSIGIEWLLSHPAMSALAFEADPVRAARVRNNADAVGVDRLQLIVGRAPECLADCPLPDAVFIGGGLSQTLLEALWAQLPAGARLVANAVTLESEALLTAWHGAKGGNLLRISLSEAVALGAKNGWRASYPVVQWSVVL